MCFTINDYSEEDIQEMKMFGTEYCTYIVFGKEIAPSTGTPHLQGYAELVGRGRTI